MNRKLIWIHRVSCVKSVQLCLTTAGSRSVGKAVYLGAKAVWCTLVLVFLHTSLSRWYKLVCHVSLQH